MKLYGIAFLILVATCAAGAGTLAYWRMGDDTSSTHDSSGNSLTLTIFSTVEDANLPYDGTTTSFHGAGAAFSDPVPQTLAPNSKAVMNYSGTFLHVADPFTVTNFTVEAYFTPYANKSDTQYLISHFTASTGQRSWAIGISKTSGLPPAVPNELYALLSANGNTNVIVPLGLIVQAGTDYYIAFSYDAGATTNDAVLRYRDLTNGGSLTTVKASSGLGVLNNPTTPLRIGSYNGNDKNMPGLIDEVRISEGLLATPHLLISPPPPDPTLLLFK